MTRWKIFTGEREPGTALDQRGEAPPWRDYSRRRSNDSPNTFRASPTEVEMVNAALHLRRPLLITGKPGCGKSSLAASVARELGLGDVIMWPINTRSTLQEGLYHYDAVGRLQAASLARSAGETPPIGKFLRLGPLGAAMYPRTKPRVILVDEIDKSDIDLPNDLLHVLEEGEFEIPELVRLADDSPEATVRDYPGRDVVQIHDGRVRASEFPVIFLTSNGEREFPPAFMRRCLHLQMKLPDKAKLESIVTAHLGPEATAKSSALIASFLEKRDGGKDLSTDQLLNAVYLLVQDRVANTDELSRLLFTSVDTGIA